MGRLRGRIAGWWMDDSRWGWYWGRSGRYCSGWYGDNIERRWRRHHQFVVICRLVVVIVIVVVVVIVSAIIGRRCNTAVLYLLLGRRGRRGLVDTIINIIGYIIVDMIVES